MRLWFGFRVGVEYQWVCVALSSNSRGCHPGEEGEVLDGLQTQHNCMCVNALLLKLSWKRETNVAPLYTIAHTSTHFMRIVAPGKHLSICSTCKEENWSTTSSRGQIHTTIWELFCSIVICIPSLPYQYKNRPKPMIWEMSLKWFNESASTVI